MVVDHRDRAQFRSLDHGQSSHTSVRTHTFTDREPTIASLPYIDADQLAALVPWRDAIAALEAVLAEQRADALADPEAEPGTIPRSAVRVSAGQLLLMPAESAQAVGFKLVGIAPANRTRGLARIQAVYLLLDAETLVPAMVLDGAALTTLRTPAVSALAGQYLAAPDVRRMVVFGSGPQALTHVEAFAAIRPIEEVTVLSRNAETAQSLTKLLQHKGFAAETWPMDASDEAVDDAELVVCATSASEPLFDGARLSARACVIAIGSHTPEAAELDETVFARAARVVVEDRTTALTEAGDVIQAMMAGALPPGALLDLADLPHVPPPAQTGPVVFKSVGMGWEDLAVAEAAAQALAKH